MGTGTSNYGLVKPTVGSDNNTWGNSINNALDTVDTQLYNKADKVDQKGFTVNISFASHTITDADTGSELKNFNSGDRVYITNASANNLNRGEFVVNSVTSDNALVMYKSDGSTDAGFTTEASVASTVSLVVSQPFTRHVFSHLTGEIKLFASTLLANVQGLGSITDGGATRYAWLLCNGASVNKVVYKDLYEILKNGGSEGVFGEITSTTFVLPDLRGRVPVGDDAMGWTDTGRMPNSADNIGNSGGAHEETISNIHLPAHTHHQTAHTHTFSGSQVITESTHSHSYTDATIGPNTGDMDGGNTGSTREYPTVNGGTSGGGGAWSKTIDYTSNLGVAGTQDQDTGAVVETHATTTLPNLQPYQVIGSYIIAT